MKPIESFHRRWRFIGSQAPKRRRMMRCSLQVCTIAIAAIALSGGCASAFAEDHDDQLAGKYGLSMMQSCIQTPRGRPPATGFDPNTGTLLQNGEPSTSVLKGVVLFRRQGDVSIRDALISDIFLDKTNVGDNPISAKTPVFCSGHYSRDDDELNFSLDCLAQLPNTLTAGIGTYQIEGLIGIGGRSITISSVSGNILTETFSIAGGVVAQSERACLVQGSLTKLRDEQH